MIYNHLISCCHCPQNIKQLLKVLKTKHKIQVVERENGAQILFFNKLWKRIHDEKFIGGDHHSANEITKILQDLCDHSLGSKEVETEQIVIDKEGPDDGDISPLSLGRYKFDHFSNIPDAMISPSIEVSNHIIPNVSDHAHMIFSSSEFDESLSKPSINLSPVETSTSSIQHPESQTKTIESTRIGHKHIDKIKLTKYTRDPPPLPDISVNPTRPGPGQIQSMQSLNVTLDMLEGFAGEILNSAQYPYRYGKRRTKTSSNSCLDIQWDQNSLKVIKNMVKSDNDYREMIEFLAQMNTSE